jgi:hypothetical protein
MKEGFLNFFSVSEEMESPTPPAGWRFENLLGLDVELREKARSLVQSRLPNYTTEHCVKLFGGSPHEYASRCALDESGSMLGVMAFTVGKLGTVEIVAFVSFQDGKGIGRFLMESFVAEMKSTNKSAILTYIEPSAFAFFSRFGFSRNVPARSLYEKITSKYVGAIFMYRELLEPLGADATERCVKEGDRLLVMVDGTLTPRQAVVKKVDSETGKVFIHYFFWNPRYDEWIFTHSPRVRWDIPLPEEPPRRFGDNMVTKEQVEKLVDLELAKEKKSEILTSNGSWPRSIKKFGQVQVRIEGNWINAKVLQKSDLYVFCEFQYNGEKWNQDFPRESVRLGDGEPSVLEALLKRSVVRKKPSKSTPVKKASKRRRSSVQTMELTPPKPRGSKPRRMFAPMSEETAASDNGLLGP